MTTIGIAAVICVAMACTACAAPGGDGSAGAAHAAQTKKAKMIELLGEPEDMEVASALFGKMAEEVMSERNHIEVGLDLLQENLFKIEYENCKMVWYATHVLIYDKRTGKAIGESQSPTFRKLLEQHEKAGLVAKYAAGMEKLSHEEKAELRRMLLGILASTAS